MAASSFPAILQARKTMAARSQKSWGKSGRKGEWLLKRRPHSEHIVPGVQNPSKSCTYTMSGILKLKPQSGLQEQRSYRPIHHGKDKKLQY